MGDINLADKAVLNNIQIWILIKFFENAGTWYNKNSILKEMCMESINDITNENLTIYLHLFKDHGLLKHNALTSKYIITFEGIKFVRVSIIDIIQPTDNDITDLDQDHELYPKLYDFLSSAAKINGEKKISYISTSFLASSALIKLIFDLLRLGVLL